MALSARGGALRMHGTPQACSVSSFQQPIAKDR